jgi:hypothetical protein
MAPPLTRHLSPAESALATNPPFNPFRINTYKSVTKHAAYNPFRIRTYNGNNIVDESE